MDLRYDFEEDGDVSEDGMEAADVVESVLVSCPYCGVSVELLVDPGGGDHQRYVEDCEVCCRPWNVAVDWFEGEAFVTLRTEDEG